MAWSDEGMDSETVCLRGVRAQGRSGAGVDCCVSVRGVRGGGAWWFVERREWVPSIRRKKRKAQSEENGEQVRWWKEMEGVRRQVGRTSCRRGVM